MVERYRERASEISCLTLPQIEEQLTALRSKPRLQAMVALLIYSGLRRGEALVPEQPGVRRRLVGVLPGSRVGGRATGPAAPVGAPGDGDAVEPGSESAGGVEGRSPGPDGHPGVLEEVLRVAPPGGHAGEEGEQGCAVPADQGLEGGLIAPLDPGHQQLVVWGGGHGALHLVLRCEPARRLTSRDDFPAGGDAGRPGELSRPGLGVWGVHSSKSHSGNLPGVQLAPAASRRDSSAGRSVVTMVRRSSRNALNASPA